MADERLKKDMRKAGEAAREMAENAMDSTEETLRETGERAASTAESLRDRAGRMRETVTESLDGARDALADSGERLAERLKRAADRTRETALGAAEVPGRMMHGVAGGVSTAAETLRNRSVTEMADDMRHLAQRHPGWFMAGAAVAGFALARMLTPRSGGWRQ